MKALILVLAVASSAPAFASLRPSYVSAEILRIEPLDAGANEYMVTYTVQPCAQKFVALQEIRLPELPLGPIPEDVTNTSLVVVLRDSGIQCAGPTERETVIYSGNFDVQNPRALK